MSYQDIARKWRPQTFDDLVGQQHVTDTLKNAIKNDRVAHAYIFSGARGVGKTTAARILAKALNCVKGPTPQPCGECDSCKEIAAGTSLDVIEIDAASNRGIDQIRELREMVRYAPAASRSKVVILDEAHMLTGEASNALLKTLEEPPDRVIFVMATTQPEDLVDTIRSRSQHFHFRALTFAEITGRLEEIARKEDLKIEAGAMAGVARRAEGSLRAPLSLLAKAAALFGEEDLTRFFQILLETDDDLRRKPDPRVHLEMGLLRLINASRLAPLEELLAELKSGVSGGGANTGAPRSAARAGASTLSSRSTAPGLMAAVPAQPKTETKVQFSSPFAAAAPAPPPTVAASTEVKQALQAEEPKSTRAAARAIGISQERVAEIKSTIQSQQKFLGELVEQSSLWELEGTELRIYFSPEKRPFAEMMEGRETLERIRNISSKVLGRPVRVCAKLEAVASAARGTSGTSGTQEL